MLSSFVEPRWWQKSGRRPSHNTLCVHPRCRRQHIAQKLSLALIDALRNEGFTYLTGRTSIAAEAMRTLFMKLQFEELPVHDTLSPERTYWLLRI
jgi:ribosomal protein S18 acetylase RimI-like enzyme